MTNPYIPEPYRSTSRRGSQGGKMTERYRARVAPEMSVALALLALWDRPWSSNAMRWAYHALHRAYARGLDVLEADAKAAWSDVATDRTT